jgi:hypothetical protein
MKKYPPLLSVFLVILFAQNVLAYRVNADIIDYNSMNTPTDDF